MSLDAEVRTAEREGDDVRLLSLRRRMGEEFPRDVLKRQRWLRRRGIGEHIMIYVHDAPYPVQKLLVGRVTRVLEDYSFVVAAVEPFAPQHSAAMTFIRFDPQRDLL